MDAPTLLPAPLTWRREVGRRIGRFWIRKMLGTIGSMAVFMVTYFWLLEHPQFPVTIMPEIGLDRLNPFWPASFGLYLSLWFYISLAPALLWAKDVLISYGLATVVLSVIGLSIFLFWPTAIAPPDIAWESYPSFQFLQSINHAGNAFPSLHVAFAVFTGRWFNRILCSMQARRRWQFINVAWCGGICYSTLATRQHVAVDVIAGATLGALIAIVHLRWIDRTAKYV